MGYGSGLPRFYPNLTWQCSPQVDKVIAEAGPGASVLDLGAGGRRAAPHVRTVDFVDQGETDYVCDVCSVPLADGSVDLVLATGLIEHVADDAALIAEARRLLRPGGVFHVESPFLQQHHDDPIDCRRFTVDGLAARLAQYGFTPLRKGFHIGPSVTIATLNAHYAGLLFEGAGPLSRGLSAAAFLAVSVATWPLKFLDRLLMNKKSAHRLAFGVYCTAAKSGS